MTGIVAAVEVNCTVLGVNVVVVIFVIFNNLVGVFVGLRRAFGGCVY